MCTQVLQRPTPEQKQQLVVYSKRVAGAVTELIQAAEAMKGERTLHKHYPPQYTIDNNDTDTCMCYICEHTVNTHPVYNACTVCGLSAVIKPKRTLLLQAPY